MRVRVFAMESKSKMVCPMYSEPSMISGVKISRLQWLSTSALVVALAGSSGVFAQTPKPVDGPDPHEIPIPSIKTSTKPLPGVDKLPVRPELPDIMILDDGTKVTSVAPWAKRRQQIKRILEYYAVGSMLVSFPSLP